MAKDIFSEMDYDYVKVVPYQIKKIAVKDCYQALVNGCRKTKKNWRNIQTVVQNKKKPEAKLLYTETSTEKRRYIPHNSWKTKNKRKVVVELRA